MSKADPRPFLPVFTVHETQLLFDDGEYRVQHLGLTYAHRVEGMGWFRDIMAKISDFFGGNVSTYSASVQKRLIGPALKEMSDFAHDLYTSDIYGGPDAIVGYSMDVDSMSSKGMSMMQVTMFGTAVKLHKIGPGIADSQAVASHSNGFPLPNQQLSA
jgi:uncharacterized protein YbjQ (UPF0145 family)